jgi:hypothetical protein
MRHSSPQCGEGALLRMPIPVGFQVRSAKFHTHGLRSTTTKHSIGYRSNDAIAALIQRFNATFYSKDQANKLITLQAENRFEPLDPINPTLCKTALFKSGVKNLSRIFCATSSINCGFLINMW